MNNIARYAAVLPMAFALSGCWGITKVPVRKVDEQAIEKLENFYQEGIKTRGSLKGMIDAACASDSRAINPASCHTVNRNEVVGDQIRLLNFHYNNYEGNILAGRAQTDFGVESLNFVFSSLAALFSPVLTKTVLSASAAFLSAGQTSNIKNLYGDSSQFALIARMRADRAAILTTIQEGLTRSYQDYPINQAETDLDSYYRAGTIAGAVQNLAGKAAKETQESDEVNTRLNQTLTRAQEALNRQLKAAGLPDSALINVQKTQPAKPVAPAGAATPPAPAAPPSQ